MTTITSGSWSGEDASTANPEQVLLVGTNHLFTEIKKKLTNISIADREVVSITGMGGIGKTALARKIYEDKDIKSHFDIQAWVTVSQSYSLKDMLQRLLESLNQTYVPTQGQSESFQLKDKIHKSLLGMRYLIVIDDIWSRDAWDDAQICFPKQSTGSRVLLTTRLTNVAIHASSGGVTYTMPTLNEKESWNLFYKKVFEKESYPCDEFEKIGKDIVMKCKGLPLAIVVIAGVLSKVKKVEDWQNIADDVKTALLTLDKEQINCEEMLSLSYKHLPPDLKTCFLFLGVFPEDYEIPIRRLIRYWVAGGFLKVEENKSEEVAKQSLQDLIDKNLISVEKRGSSGKVKTFKIHDLIHEMCSKLAKEKNILHVFNDKLGVGQSSKELKQENGYCWVSLQSIPDNCDNICQLGIDDISKCHSFLVISSFPLRPLRTLSLNYIQFKSIKVLDLLQFNLPRLPSPHEMDNLYHLRCLALSIKVSPQSFPILNLKNLQIFTLRRISGPRIVPLTISKTPHLMHLSFLGGTICFNVGENNSLLEHLTSVTGLSASCCTNKELMMKIPNVKKLRVRCDEVDYNSNIHPIYLLNILSHLLLLENLSYNGPSTFNPSFRPMPVPILNDFPPKLKKLTFQWTWMEWKIMTILGRLPNLQVLDLKMHAFVDSEWKQTEEGFQKLKVLAFEWLSLNSCIDSDYSFPRLERIMLKHCYHLKTLPYNFLSGCPNLKLIDLERCTNAILASARQIREDGDGELEVRASNIIEIV